ncbi:MAG: hypothetical protein OXN83_04080 [Oligoflexia bacterium]|nr:hypothetical protein [Oligoflexia bacterium]
MFFRELSTRAFLIALGFSYLYAGLFFYSIKLIFTQKRKLLGVLLLFCKWLLLLLALLLVSWFLDGKAFLLGLSSLLVILTFYILEQVRVFK